MGGLSFIGNSSKTVQLFKFNFSRTPLNESVFDRNGSFPRFS